MERIEGFLIIDKPQGITSADVVRVVKKALKVKKVGYIGTLDPIATGVLPVGIGRATKVFPFLEKMDKVYEATMTLGSATDTQDSTGAVTSQADPSGITDEMVKEAMAGFTGEIQQIPPMYSAKKIDGERLYDLARQGITVERKPVTAHIKELSFISKEGNVVRFTAKVSTGSYIRTLCNDIGEKLGVYAHLSGLIRAATGHFTLENSIPLDELKEGGFEKAQERILSLSDGLSNLSKAVVIAHAVDRLRNGMPVSVSEVATYEDAPGTGYVRIVNKTGELMAIGMKTGIPMAGFPFTTIQPKKVLL
ncbi:MAG: tRNA pseudouridine(55) synthase TruB [Nitrospinae bacterium]|nr:tRNA pseudouridine(55) synthase TruB [Nitrospinota bacterium]